MNGQCLAKCSPIRLREHEYGKLREKILRRDNWRCQICGSRINLQVHHHYFRSHSGEDRDENLITLCYDCHSKAHHVKVLSDETS